MSRVQQPLDQIDEVGPTTMNDASQDQLLEELVDKPVDEESIGDVDSVVTISTQSADTLEQNDEDEPEFELF